MFDSERLTSIVPRQSALAKHARVGADNVSQQNKSKQRLPLVTNETSRMSRALCSKHVCQERSELKWKILKFYNETTREAAHDNFRASSCKLGISSITRQSQFIQCAIIRKNFLIRMKLFMTWRLDMSIYGGNRNVSVLVMKGWFVG